MAKRPDVEIISLKAAVARVGALFGEHGIKPNPFDGKAIVDAVEGHWAIMEDERTSGSRVQSWGCSVFDFDEPPTFLVFDIGAESVTVCVGAAELSAAKARDIADDAVGPSMSNTLKRIEKSPKGWVSTLHVKRSEFELEPLDYPKPTFK